MKEPKSKTTLTELRYYFEAELQNNLEGAGAALMYRFQKLRLKLLSLPTKDLEAVILAMETLLENSIKNAAKDSAKRDVKEERKNIGQKLYQQIAQRGADTAVSGVKQ